MTKTEQLKMELLEQKIKTLEMEVKYLTLKAEQPQGNHIFTSEQPINTYVGTQAVDLSEESLNQAVIDLAPELRTSK